MRYILVAASFAAVLALPGVSSAGVIINEFVYDDGGTDDREFVELYNTGPGAVDISGWTVGGRDASTTNPTVTIPAATSLAASDYYVVGNTGVVNVDLVAAANSFENDDETLELRDGPFATGVLVDSVTYERNIGSITLPADVAAQVGPGYYGAAVAGDSTAGLTRFSLGRYVDGRDTNNNGRDLGMLQSTPGTTNNPLNITHWATPPVVGQVPETTVPNFASTFVSPRYVDPTVVSATNLNAIPAAPTANRAIMAWDPSGGGNTAVSTQTFDTSASGFDFLAYFDTRNLPQSTNASGVIFRSSEFSMFGVGGNDAVNFPLIDISGTVGQPDSTNGLSGVAWIYEKVGETGAGLGDVSEKLYLIDAGDGGDGGQAGTRPFDWTILATVDLSSTASGWYRLALNLDGAGNGVAIFDNQSFNFVTGLHSGKFMVGYRENTQNGADGTPDAILRPPTFTIPEPATLALVTLGLAVLASWRRR